VSIGAVLVLVALDRRQPARRQRLAPRGRPLPAPGPAGDADRARAAGAPTAVVRELPSRPYRRTPIWRRLVAVAGLSVLTTVIGAILAIAVAAAAIGLMLALSGATR